MIPVYLIEQLAFECWTTQTYGIHLPTFVECANFSSVHPKKFSLFDSDCEQNCEPSSEYSSLFSEYDDIHCQLGITQSYLIQASDQLELMFNDIWNNIDDADKAAWIKYGLLKKINRTMAIYKNI